MFLTLEFPDCPFFTDGLVLVETAFQWIVDLQEFDNMGPTQLVRQRRTFWVGEVKLTNPDHLASTETLAVTWGQVAAETGKQAFAILGPGFAALLKLHNVVADLPVSFGDVGIDSLMGADLTRSVNLGNTAQQPLVFGIGSQFHGVWCFQPRLRLRPDPGSRPTIPSRPPHRTGGPASTKWAITRKALRC